jgi:hypothetical protein
MNARRWRINEKPWDIGDVISIGSGGAPCAIAPEGLWPLVRETAGKAVPFHQIAFEVIARGTHSK